MMLKRILVILLLVLSACGTNGPFIFSRQESPELDQLPEVKVRWTPEIEYSIRYMLVLDKSFIPEAYERREDYYSEIKDVFDSYGIPQDLINIALIESRFNNQAKSSYGAAGLWQFMAPTARQYGLTVNFFRDERYHPAESSVAAAKYLRALYREFGDWDLVLAAYNAGDNKIRKAIQENNQRDFWKLVRLGAIPGQTKAFVSRVNAAILIERKGLVAAIKDFRQHQLADVYEALKRV